MGLCAYYRRFVAVTGFADIHVAAPLYKLTEKKVSFYWTEKQDNAFVELKDHLVTTPILRIPKR